MSVIGRNIFWLLVSQLATWMATLVALVVVPNSLGSADLGSFGYAAGYVQFFTLVAGLGTSTYLARAVARDSRLAGPYVWNAVLLKLVLWAVLSAAAVLLAMALGNSGDTLLMIAIGCGGMLVVLLNEVFSGTLGGMQRLARPAMWTVVQVYYQTFVGILVLALGWGVVAYAVVMTTGAAIPMVATWLMVRPMVRGHRSIDLGIWRLLVVGGIPLAALSFFNLIYGTVNVPILHHVAGSEPVGWYLVALRWVGIPIFITTAVVAAYFPAFSQHGNPVTAEFSALVNRAVHLVLVVTLPASFGLMVVADDLVRVVYEDEYSPSIVLVRILALQVPISAMDTVLATALVASHRLKPYLFVAAAAAVVNPIACFVAVHVTADRYGNGAIGAAWVMVGTELWVTIGAWRLRSPGVLDAVEVRRILRILAATAAMAPAALVGASWPLPVQVALGIVSYAVASLAFRAISIAELREMTWRITRARRGEPFGDQPDERSGEDESGTGDPDSPRVGGDLHPQP